MIRKRSKLKGWAPIASHLLYHTYYKEFSQLNMICHLANQLQTIYGDHSRLRMKRNVRYQAHVLLNCQYWSFTVTRLERLLPWKAECVEGTKRDREGLRGSERHIGIWNVIMPRIAIPQHIDAAYRCCLDKALPQEGLRGTERTEQPRRRT